MNELPRCETSSTTTGGLCLLTTVPVRADADQIIAAYLSFAKKHIEVESNPDNPDWAGLQALVVPEIREEARTEIEVRFKRGETLNTTAGVTFNPQISRLSYPDDFIQLTDCRVDGTYWSDRASGTAVAGQAVDAHRRTFRADLRRIGVGWLLTYYQYVAETCAD